MARNTWFSILPGLSIIGALAMSASSAPDSLNTIYQGKFSNVTEAPKSLKLLNWNIERGLQFSGIVRAIESERPDICIGR